MDDLLNAIENVENNQAVQPAANDNHSSITLAISL
jgi:hypothetical protein